MKTIRSAALVIVILLVAAFGMLSQQTGGKPSSSLVGAWKLTTVQGKDPVTISIKSWRIEFREQGKWEYSGTMAGEYEGTKLSGSGTWTLEGKQLEYTAGTNKGQTVVYVIG